MKLSKPIESLLKKNTWRSLQRTTQSCGANVFGYIEFASTVAEDFKTEDSQVHLTLRWMLTQTPVTSTVRLKIQSHVFQCLLICQVNIDPLQKSCDSNFSP